MNRFLACSSVIALCAAFAVSSADAQTQTAPTVATVLAEQIQHARELRGKGDLDGAAKILRQLMLVASNDPRVLGEYGKVLTEQGHAKDAVGLLARATLMNGTDWTLYSALGVAYDQTDDHADARKAYDRALAMKPGEPTVLNNYAVSRMLTGDYAGAAQMLAQLQKTDAANPKIAANLERAQALAGTQLAKAPAVAASVQPVKPAAAAPQQPHAVTAANNGVVMQKVPVDPKAGPVRAATAAPKSLPGSDAHRPALAAAASKLKVAPASIVMQKVPADPKAGPAKMAQAPLRKQPVETARAAVKTAVPAAPSLRTASD
ncbi:MAG: tetratricopeptide repeat protein [Rhizomicrobium sp.]